MAWAKGFEDLRIYQLSRELSRFVFEVTKSFPKEERYSLTDQFRRASRSVGAQISEAWSKRRYVKHFESKLTDADGELNETRHWINTASDCDYLQPHDLQRLRSLTDEIGRMINGMLFKAGQFNDKAPREIRDDWDEYLVIPTPH